MSELRYVEIQEENLNFPVDGQIHLVENFFAGNGYIVCSWPFYFDTKNNSEIREILITKNLDNGIDFVGRTTTNKGFQIEIYQDGSVEKKYIIK